MDSSSIVKLYVDEEHATETRQTVAASDRVATASIAYVEVKAAFARHRRERRIRTRNLLQRVNNDFDADWPAFVASTTSTDIIQRAAELVAIHPLSGYDAVHLATALSLRSRTPEEVSFSSWDGQLARAAQAEGLSLAHEVNT